MTNLIQNLQSQLNKLKGKVQNTGKVQNSNHTVNLVHIDDMAGDNFTGKVIVSPHIAFNTFDNLEPG